MIVPPPGPIDAHVGQRLRLRRFALGISQEDDLGAALGVSFQQIQKYEKGENRVGAARLPVLAGALQTNVGYFFEEFAGATALPVRTPIDEFLSLREGPQLALAFVAIRNPRLRTALLAHARALATASESAIVAALEAAASANAKTANAAPVGQPEACDIDRRST